MNRLRETRLNSGETQVDLAERIGVNQNTISSYELERSVPSLAVAKRLAKHYGRTVEFLFPTKGEKR